MKTKFLLLLSLSVIIGACSTEDEILSTLWGIDFSGDNSSGFAMGTVDQFKAESKTTYIVKMANLRSSGGDVYTMSYTFESNDSMEIHIVKRTNDQNYPFPGKSGENQLLSATFNGEPLNLTDESRISIQPRTDENKLATITKLLTLDKGFFDGAIGRVPLLK